jgi:kinetochor protein Mis14/NSL1
VPPEQFLKEASSAAATRQSSSTAVDEEVYEPFDTAKRRRLAELVTQEETLLEQVAALKRSVPANVAAEHERTLTEALRRDEELLQATLERAGKRDPASSVKLDIQALERQEGVESGFKKAVDGLARLKREMPSVVARMERARVAGEYVVSDRQ